MSHVKTQQFTLADLFKILILVPCTIVAVSLSLFPVGSI